MSITLMSTSEMTLGQQVQEQIAHLKEALLAGNPTMPTMLRTIHKALSTDPAIVTLLSPEEIGTVVAGLMKQTNTVIAVAAVKKPAGKSKKAITLDDL